MDVEKNPLTTLHFTGEKKSHNSVKKRWQPNWKKKTHTLKDGHKIKTRWPTHPKKEATTPKKTKEKKIWIGKKKLHPFSNK